jgi:type IV pilus assembly protein PilV
MQAGGFSLIEVLVAVLVFAIGVLGVVGLQTVGMQANSDSSTRSQALALAYDMADRMRANLPAVNATTSTDRYDGVTPAINNCRMRYANAQVSTPSVCTPPQIAADDIADWRLYVARALPNGTGIVCRDATPDDGTDAAAAACSGAGTDPLVVKVFWMERLRQGSVAATPRRVAMMVRP